MTTQAANLKNIIGSEPNYQAPQNQLSVNIDPAMAKAVKELFESLCAAFPAWKQAFPNADMYRAARKLWLETLLSERVSVQQIQRGLNFAKKSNNPFFPSVGQFIEWCNSGNQFENLGLPTAEELITRYRQYRASDCETPEEYPWQSAVEYHLALQLKTAIYQGNLSDEKTLTRAKTLIGDMAKYLAGGGTVAAPKTPKLTATVSRQISQTEKLDYLAGMRAMVKKGAVA